MESQILKNRSLVALKLHFGTGCEGKDDHFYPKKRSIQIHLSSKKMQCLDRFQKERQEIQEAKLNFY